MEKAKHFIKKGLEKVTATDIKLAQEDRKETLDTAWRTSDDVSPGPPTNLPSGSGYPSGLPGKEALEQPVNKPRFE
ncbi:hypothetical protein N0V88_007390 [Collariella sp. IMI 366227]|nr:hypothetical protein N0V88_007390 [Collariella sp. IMI 366227]